MKFVIVAANINYLQFILKQIDLSFVDIVRVFVPEGPFVEDFSIKMGERNLKGAPFEMMHDALLDLSYDYILVVGFEDNIVSEIKRVGIPKEKIIDSRVLHNVAYFIEKFRLFHAVSKFDRIYSFKIIITGLSYAYFGTELGLYSLPAINLAGISQDLYYDYMIVKKFLSMGGETEVRGDRIGSLQLSS